MQITVKYQDLVLATASSQDFQTGKALKVEGNYYFDQSLINSDLLKMKDSGGQYTCPIKQGTCDYYNLIDQNGQELINEVGWIYPKVNNSLFVEIEGKMAFYPGKVEFVEA